MGRLAGRRKVQRAALQAASLTTAAANATAAAGATPTKAEFDALVTLANELKADHNALVTALKS